MARIQPNKWELGSHMGTIFSAAIAFAALACSLWQFVISNNKTDLQISILREERLARINEGRPIITVDSTGVFFRRDYPLGPPEWYYELHISNIGERPAYELKFRGVVVATDGINGFVNNELASVDTFNFPNPINKGGKNTLTGGVGFRKLRDYYLKIEISYKDTLLKKPFYEKYYYSVSLYKLLPGSAYENVLFDITTQNSKSLDSTLEVIQKAQSGLKTPLSK